MTGFVFDGERITFLIIFLLGFLTGKLFPKMKDIV